MPRVRVRASPAFEPSPCSAPSGDSADGCGPPAWRLPRQSCSPVKHGMHEDTGHDMSSVPEDKSYFGLGSQRAVTIQEDADAAACHQRGIRMWIPAFFGRIGHGHHSRRVTHKACRRRVSARHLAARVQAAGLAHVAGSTRPASLARCSRSLTMAFRVSSAISIASANGTTTSHAVRPIGAVPNTAWPACV